MHGLNLSPAELDQLRRTLHRYATRLSPGSPGSIDLDDLEQSGWEGVLKAARAFDRYRGVPFLAYAARRALAEMVDELRRNGRPRRDGPRARPMLVDNGTGVALAGSEPSSAEGERHLEEWLEALTVEERRLLRAAAFDGLPRGRPWRFEAMRAQLLAEAVP